MVTPLTPQLRTLIQTLSTAQRPLLFANARVITQDPLIGDFERADVLLGDSRIVGIGPGLLTAADDDGAIVIDCDGYTILPAVIDLPQLHGLRPPGHRGVTSLAPGNASTFAVIPNDETASGSAHLRRFLKSPNQAAVILVDGEVAVWDTKPAEPPTPSSSASTYAAAVPDRYLGTWIDENDFVHQHLTADGRYDETRGGRLHAFQGTFWVNGDRIDYRDDLGFWAFGEFSGDALHHAGYTFHRA